MADGSKPPKEQVVEELIIVRRSQPEEAGHKGGAWKIAYADFVTAMMAFFLVMWLINAANEKTKAQVASYFNPVKLVDNTTSAKGIKTPGDRSAKSSGEHGGDSPPTTEAAETAEKPSEEKPSEEKPPAEEEKKPEAAAHEEKKPAVEGKAESQGAGAEEAKLFEDPFKVLAQIARQQPAFNTGKSEKSMVIKETERPDPGVGDLTRDPFDPLAWKLVVPEERSAELPKPEEKTASDPSHQDANSKQAAVDHENSPEPEPEPEKKEATLSAKAKLALKEAEQIRTQLSEELTTLGTKHPDVRVKTTQEGILISLTDSASFDMFDVGSAKPRPVVVKLMEKVAAALKDYKGRIIVRGHTDGRPYRGNGYDNWRLSMARAQMAYYMLIRAGVDDGAVERIEGYADKSLFNDKNALSAENRRIEILLKVAEP